MELKELIIGETVFSNKILGYQAKNISAKKWLYLIGGIHGNEVEGIYVLKQFLNWINHQLAIDLPLIIIPILNIDGYQSNSRFNARNVDLNRNFPVSSKRQNLTSYSLGEPLKEPESFYLKKFLDEFPPQMLLTFHSNLNGQISCLGETGENIGEFLAKYNKYSLTANYQPCPGSLEAFVFDFYLGPVVNLKVGQCNGIKSLQEIWQENESGPKLLLKNQAY